MLSFARLRVHRLRLEIVQEVIQGGNVLIGEVGRGDFRRRRRTGQQVGQRRHVFFDGVPGQLK